jgi:hypothetical protein
MLRVLLRGGRGLNKTLTSIFLAIGLLQAPQGFAQAPGAPGGVSDADTLNTQSKAEELFDRGDYRRAHFIYRNELASIGDKYAQYMLGYMSLAGLGVEQDPIVASAWFRVAAERNTPELVAVRDELMDKFDDADVARSDAAYVDLRKTYSDIAVRMQLVRRYFEVLRSDVTGSRLGRSAAPVAVVRPGEGYSQSVEAYFREVERHMQSQLDLITDALGVDSVEFSLSEEELESLEARVAEHVNRVDDR